MPLEEINPGIRTSCEPVGYCIYCGAADCDLTVEHIVPNSLGGRVLLPQATCQACQRIINEQYEQYCLRSLFGNARSAFELKRDRKRGRSSSPRLPSLLVNNGDDHRVRHEFDGPFPLIVYMPVFTGPYALLDREIPLQIIGDTWLYQDDFTDDEMARLKPGVTTELIYPDKFGRWLAKIAHSSATAILGAGSFHPHLRRIILDETTTIRDIVQYVGVYKFGSPSAGTFAIDFFRERGPSGVQWITAHLCLFGSLGAPTFRIAVGISRDDQSLVGFTADDEDQSRETGLS